MPLEVSSSFSYGGSNLISRNFRTSSVNFSTSRIEILVKLVPGRDADLPHEFCELSSFDDFGRGRPGDGLVFEEVGVVHIAILGAKMKKTSRATCLFHLFLSPY